RAPGANHLAETQVELVQAVAVQGPGLDDVDGGGAGASRIVGNRTANGAGDRRVGDLPDRREALEARNALQRRANLDVRFGNRIAGEELHLRQPGIVHTARAERLPVDCAKEVDGLEERLRHFGGHLTVVEQLVAR